MRPIGGLVALALAVPTPAAAQDGPIGFAPPTDRSLELVRRTERAVPGGTLIVVNRYTLRFAAMGRGYVLSWRQESSDLSGPPELLRILALGEALLEGEELSFSLAGDGSVLGVRESPERQAMLVAAIERLRADPAFLSDTPENQARKGAILDRLAAMDAAERADLSIAKLAPLLDLAGRTVADGRVEGRTGTLLCPGADAGTGETNFTSCDDGPARSGEPEVEIGLVLARDQGLVHRFTRDVTTRVGETAFASREILVLTPLAPEPESPVSTPPPIGEESGR